MEKLLPLLTFALVIFLYLFFKIKEFNRAYQETNRKDWKINLLPKPSLFVRIFNILVGKFGASLLITLLEKTLVNLALKKSLEQMKEAELSGKVPDILCDLGARKAMKERQKDYADGMRLSIAFTSFAKTSLYAGTLRLLSNHVGLLKLGMEANNEVVCEPVFIVSMPRTATTVLHRTMATDTSQWNTFDLADMVLPLPPIARSDLKNRAKLVNKVQKTVVNLIKRFYPGWFKCLETMNPQVIDEADEDLGMYNSGLGILYQDTLLHLLPKKNTEQMALESTEIAVYRYAWLNMIMRIYQKLEPENKKPWLMKDPKHSAFLPQLIQEFPDARFIFTHRAPSEILASMAKLFVCFSCVSVNLGRPGTRSADWGEYTLKKTVFFLDGIVEYTKNYPMPKNKRIDFIFSELRTDLMGSIEKIYEMCFHQEPSRQAKSIMTSYLERENLEKREAQPRQLKDFQLTEEDVAFDEYRKIFL